MESDTGTSAETTRKIHNDFSYVFTGIGCSRGTYSLKIKDDPNTYQVLPGHVPYTLLGSLRDGESTRTGDNGTARA